MIPQKDLSVLQFLNFVGQMTRDNGLTWPHPSLRAHTKSHHAMTITEYKDRFGPDLVPVEVVWHQCGVCGELVMLDSDHVAVHLKKRGRESLNDCYIKCHTALLPIWSLSSAWQFLCKYSPWCHTTFSHVLSRTRWFLRYFCTSSVNSRQERKPSSLF